MFTIKINII